MSNFKSNNDEYITIKHRKPSKLVLAGNPDVNYYAGFRIDKANGPYSANNKWCIDTKYYPKLDKTYEIPLENILDDENQDVHDSITENLNNKGWNKNFIRWFCSKAVPQPLLHSLGDSIYSNGKYIVISWIANDQHRLCWNGFNTYFYVNNVMLYGGQEINVHSSMCAQKFVFFNDIMYYASNKCVLVANNFCDPMSRLLSLANHDKKICMMKTLYLYLRKIRMYHLKHFKYGKEKELKIPVLYELFVPYVVDILKRKRIYYEQTQKDLFFNVNDTVGDSIFGENIFSKMYKNDKVFCYSIQFIHRTKKNELWVKYYILQQDQSKQNAPILGFSIVDKS